MNRAESAVSDFRRGFSCSQAVLAAFAESLELDRNTALKLGAGFGGGMGRMALTCGAVTGAFMVIGLKHGATDAGDREAKEKTQRIVREFAGRFKERNSSITCRDLLHCDISTLEGFEEAKEKNFLMTVCPKLVRDAVEILEEIL